jgi:hypothetical protein
LGWIRTRSDREGASELRTPLARTDELVTEQVDDEVLVYDQRHNTAHCLSDAAASVWRACDGRTTIKALTTTLGLDRETVASALQELEERELLEGQGVTRREASLKLAKVAGGVAVASPLIYSISAPPPAAAVTSAYCLKICPTGCGGCQKAGCCCCNPGGGSTKVCGLTCSDCCTVVSPNLGHCNQPITSLSCSAGCGGSANSCVPNAGASITHGASAPATQGSGGGLSSSGGGGGSAGGLSSSGGVAGSGASTP